MKKVLGNFTFWFIIVGIIVVLYNLAGQDDKNIIMIGLNPIMVALDNQYCRPIINGVPYLSHLLSLISMTLYGVILDLVKSIIKRRRK
jgi:hypothetical protein